MHLKTPGSSFSLKVESQLVQKERCLKSPQRHHLGGRSNCLPAAWLRVRPQSVLDRCDSAHPVLRRRRRAPVPLLTCPAEPALPVHPLCLRGLEALLAPAEEGGRGYRVLSQIQRLSGHVHPLSPHSQGINVGWSSALPGGPSRLLGSRSLPATLLGRRRATRVWERLPGDSPAWRWSLRKGPRASQLVCSLFVPGRGNRFGKHCFGVPSAGQASDPVAGAGASGLGRRCQGPSQEPGCR